MADIKNITIDGTTYDLKDAKAREDVSDLKEDLNHIITSAHFITTAGVWLMVPYHIGIGDTIEISSDNLPSDKNIVIYARETPDSTSVLVGTLMPGETITYTAQVNLEYLRFMSSSNYDVDVITTNTKYFALENNYNDFKNEVNDELYTDSFPYASNDGNWMQGNLSANSPTDTTFISATTRLTTTQRIAIDAGTKLHFDCPDNGKYRVLFFVEAGPIAPSTTYVTVSGLDDYNTWHTDSRVLTVPDGASAFAVSIAYTDDRTVTPSTRPSFAIYKSTLNGRVEELESKVDALYPINFNGKKISILGDSISTFAGENPSTASDDHTIADGTYTYAGNHCRYPNSFLTNVNDTYWKKLIDALGLSLGINDSWAGSKVSWDGSEGSDYGANIYIASPTRIGHLDDNGTPDYILVNAGTNDIGSSVTPGTFNTESPVNYTDEQIAALPVATFADAYRALLIRLQKKYPLARIVVMLPNYTTSYYNPTSADTYLEIIKEACDYFGVPWVDMRTTGITMFNTGTYTGDGIHPNVSGMKLLFEKVCKFFEFSL